MDDYEYNEKAVKKKLIKEGVPETLATLRQLLLEIEPFEAVPLERLLHDYVEQSGEGFGAVMPPLRVFQVSRAVLICVRFLRCWVVMRSFVG